MAKTVVATTPRGSRRVFKNIQAAAEFLVDSVEPGANASKYRAMLASLFKNQREMAGYTWSKSSASVVAEEVVEEVEVEEVEEVEVEEADLGGDEVEEVGSENEVLNTEADGRLDITSGLDSQIHQNPESESFFELVDSIFRGDGVRVCVIDNVKMVSAYDVISIISESTAQWKIYQRLCDANPEVKTFVYMYQFSGARQRPTPVVDAQGFHVIAMLTPGRHAGQFRVKAAEVLKKYLEGNLEELRETPAPAYQEALGHSNHLYRLARPSAARHDGQSLANFAGACVYILAIKVEDKDMLKIGRSDDFNARLAQHDKVFDVQEVYSITPCEKNLKLERAVKDRLRNYNHPVEIGGKRYTELYLGLTLEEADDVVQKCAKDLEAGDDRAFQMRMKEIELQMKVEERHVKAEERHVKAEERRMKEFERDVRLAEIELEKLRLQAQMT